MKKYLMLICLLNILLSSIFAQVATSKYPLGMYITYNGNCLDRNNQTVMTQVQPLLKTWKNSLGFNWLLGSFDGGYTGYDGVPALMNFDGGADIRNGGITPVVVSNYLYNSGTPVSGLSLISEAHYLKFDVSSADKYKINFSSNSSFACYPDAYGYVIESSIEEFRLIDNLNVTFSQGNRSLIRPRTLNTITPDNNNQYAKFTLEITYDNYDDPYATLVFNLTNGNPAYSTSDFNFQPISGTYVTLNKGSNIKKTIDFNLWIKKAGSPVSFSAYEFIPSLTVDCWMMEGSQIRIRSIKIYDDMGRRIVEDGYPFNSTVNGFNYTNWLASFKSSAGTWTNPIIHLVDECVIGNFIPMCELQKRINSQCATIGGITPRYYITAPVGDDLQTQAVYNELLSNVRIDYMGKDYYPFDNGESPVDYQTFWNNINGLYNEFCKTNQLVKNIHSSTSVFGVLQNHKWIEGACNSRHPSRSELLAESYASLISGHKGILYYWSGPEIYPVGQSADVCNKEGIYKNLSTNNTGFDLTYESINHLNNMNNIIPEQRDVFTNYMSGFLSATADGSAKTGDILFDSKYVYSDLVGVSNVNRKTYSSSTFATASNTAAIVSAEIVNNSTGNTSAEAGLFGIAKFDKKDDSNVCYYLIADMRMEETTSNLRVRLGFQNSHSKLISVTDLTNSSVINRMYPSNGIVVLSIPAHKAILLKVENISRGTCEFPNGQGFGVFRINADNTHSFIFDTDFGKDPANGLINMKVSDASYSAKGFIWNETPTTSRAVILKPYYYTDPIKNINYTFAEFDFYSITRSAGTQTPYLIKRIDISPYVNSLEEYSIDPITGDFQNTGNNDYGFIIKHDNVYSIFKVSNYVPVFIKDIISINGYANGSVLLGRWNANLTTTLNGSPYVKSYFGLYEGSSFYLDKNGDGTLNPTTESIPMTLPSYNYPVIGNWTRNIYYWTEDNVDEYGLYGTDPWFSNYMCFRLNFGGENGYSYFEYPFGNPYDQPFVWRTSTAISKSVDEQQTESEEGGVFNIKSYPNPFNPQTTFRFNLPFDAHVKLTVYNILGDVVTILLNENMSMGVHRIKFDGSKLSSGIYLYRIEANRNVLNGKILLLK